MSFSCNHRIVSTGALRDCALVESNAGARAGACGDEERETPYLRDLRDDWKP